MKTKLKKSLVLLLLAAMVVTTLAGVNAAPTKVEASENLVADEATIYGLTDLGAETQVVSGVAGGRPLVYAGANVTKSLGATNTVTNVSIILDVEQETLAQVVYYFCKADATNVADGSGYAVSINPQFSEMAICQGTATNENVLVAGTAPKNKSYEVEFGVVDMRDGQGTLMSRKVYVKIDGAEVASYVDTNLERTLGKNVAFFANGSHNAGALVTVSPRSYKADATTVYGLTDLGAETQVVPTAANGRPLVYAGPNVTMSLGATESATNVSVILETQAETLEQVVYYIGKADATNMADGSGYAIAVRPQSTEMAICQGTATNANVLTTGVVPKNKVYEVEFGIVDMRDGQGTLMGRRVYVKIDGAEVASYFDTNLERTLGKNVAFFANGAQRAGALVTVAPRSLNLDSTKIYSLYDLMGVNSVNLTTAYNLLGATSSASNTRVQLTLNINSTEMFQFGLARQTTGFSDGTGYQFRINPGSNWIRIYGSNYDTPLAQATLGITSTEGVRVEFGIVDMRDNEGTLLARKVFAKANGAELIAYYDYNIAHPIGNNVLVKMPANVGMGTFNSAVSSKVVKYNEIAEYRENGNFTTPTAPDGYVFAGWYAEESCDKETALTDTTVSGPAYAKFVDAKLSEVRAQIKTVASDSAAIRFLTSIDGLSYGKIGFKITAKGTTVEVGSNSVYKQLVVTKFDGETFEKNPDQVFGQQAQYFKAYVIKGIPQADYDEAIEVTPYWITLDGTTVYGTTAVKTIEQGLAAE